MTNKISSYLKDLDAVLISSPANIIYLIGDFEFATSERDCFILITKKKKYIITDHRYSEAIEKQTKNFEIIETGATSFTYKTSNEFFAKNKIEKVGFEADNLSVSEYVKLKKTVKLIPIDLTNLRIIKTNDEIKNIRKACKIGDQAFNFILNKFKIGITEKEIVEFLVSFFKSENADISFKPIVAFGKNSSVPHHLSNNTKLKKNQIILLDFGVKVNNYCSDMSRTIFFGKAPDEFKKMYQVVLDAQRKAIESIKIGVETKQIDKTARDYILNQRYPNIIHAVGHGIGIEVHENPGISPISKEKVQKGMVFSVEPGIYITNFGGIRIEDLVSIGKRKVELLSHSNKGIIEL